MSHKNIVLWIDEEQRALDTYTDFLQDCLGDEAVLVAELPKDELGEMLKRITTDPSLVAIVLDQRLKATGKANYTGIELAEAIRRADAKLPLYMLTNHPEDIGDLEFQVEYVLAKDFLHEAQYQKTVSARVRRHINVYNDIVSDREQRYDELLRKSLTFELSGDEEDELSALDFWRNKAIFAEEEHWAGAMKKELDEQEHLLTSLRREIAEKSEDKICNV